MCGAWKSLTIKTFKNCWNKKGKNMPKAEFGQKCLVDTFKILPNGCLFIEMDGLSWDSSEYESNVEMLQSIVDHAYSVSLGVGAPCACCGLELNLEECKENQGKCFHCLKGNCETCG